MKHLLWAPFACAVVLGANDTELEQLKQQMIQMQKQMALMQEKINALESSSASNVASNSGPAEESLESLAINEAKTQQTTLLPDIALIMNGGYASRNVSNERYGGYAIPGFIGAGEAELPFNRKDGFNFNYTEVAMSSTINPYFDGNVIFHIGGDGEVEIEEAFFTTRSLDYGLKLKAGKFKSAFGRVNEKHHHAWNFEDQELVNNVFFGPDGLGGEGAQLQWVAPTPFYLMAGVELFDGNPEQGFSAKESATTGVGYLKSSLGAGDATILSGLSYAQGKAQVQDLDGAGNPIPYSYSDYGQTRIFGGDLTVQYPLGAFSSLQWQNEWMQRNRDTASGTDVQAGYYSELLYKMDENWGAGIRYDDLYKNIAGSPENLNRISVKLEYTPFEFSRIRLQYNRDDSKEFDNGRRALHEVMLNYTFELGAHGAHPF